MGNTSISVVLVGGYNVRTDGDLVSLNDLYALAGSPKNQSPYEWSRLPTTVQLIDTIASNLNIYRNCLYKTKRGRHKGGSFAHFYLALRYCTYLGIESTYNAIASYFNQPSKEFIINTIRHEFSFDSLLIDLIRNGRKIKEYNKGNGLTIIKQHKCLGYMIDFYLPEVNIAIEYDEEHHDYCRNMIEDIRRQYLIENELGCKFIRVKKGNEGSGMANIYHEICFAVASNGDPMFYERINEAIRNFSLS